MKEHTTAGPSKRPTEYRIVEMAAIAQRAFEHHGYEPDGVYMRKDIGHARVLVHMAITTHSRCLTIDVLERPEVPGSSRASMTVPGLHFDAEGLDAFAVYCARSWGAV